MTYTEKTDQIVLTRMLSQNRTRYRDANLEFANRTVTAVTVWRMLDRDWSRVERWLKSNRDPEYRNDLRSRIMTLRDNMERNVA